MKTRAEHNSATASERARARLLQMPGEPLFYADWLRTLFIHFEIEPAILQPHVAYELDLWEGRAHVSLGAFEMAHLRPRIGGRLGALLFAPIANHAFLNVRTYVRCGNETGIHFMTEWVSNPLTVPLGPATYGLPYRFGRLEYRHDEHAGNFEGCVAGMGAGRVTWRGTSAAGNILCPCVPGTLAESLLERYTAFTCYRGIRRSFRIWHEPWPQMALRIDLPDRTLLTSLWPWFEDARLVESNYSPGVPDVWIGRPHRCNRTSN